MLVRVCYVPGRAVPKMPRNRARMTSSLPQTG